MVRVRAPGFRVGEDAAVEIRKPHASMGAAAVDLGDDRRGHGLTSGGPVEARPIGGSAMLGPSCQLKSERQQTVQRLQRGYPAVPALRPHIDWSCRREE